MIYSSLPPHTRPRTPRSGYAILAALGIGLLALLIGCSQTTPNPPPTPVHAVSDTYHEVTVTESYRWLESADDPEVVAWNEGQNTYSRSLLDALPDRDAIAERLQELYGEEYTTYYGLQWVGDRLFAMKSQPPHEQPFLVSLESVHRTDPEHVILNLNTLDTSFMTAVDFFVPSYDGSRLAVSLSRRGSEHGTLHLYRVEDGRALPDTVPRVNGPTAGGGVAWLPDGSGFFYTRYPHPGERAEEDLSFYQQVYLHRLGTPWQEDTYAIGEEFPRIAEIDFITSNDGRYICAIVSNGDGGEYAHYLYTLREGWRQVTRFEDRATKAEFAPDGALYLLSYQNALRGKLLRLPPGIAELSRARVVVPESEVAIQQFMPTSTLLYVVDILGGPSRVRIYRPDGAMLEPWSLEPISAVGGLTDLGEDRVIFNVRTYTAPAAWYEYDPASGEAKRTALYSQSSADYSNVEVVREFATSKDGTKIPINIIRNKGIELDGRHPTVLYGYGGYGINQMPRMSLGTSLWLNQGGVYAIANIRGGGEYGEAWHLAGNLTNKQNVFDDFIACAEHLIAAGYTSPERLAIEGGSNGGLLMGAAMTQRPDLFRAVVSYVGVYDMLRVELDPNGEFNTTEFGTVKNPDHFAALYAYSPYHNVRAQTPYPAALLLTGAHDGRVNPAHSWKMTAALQAATTSGHPVLLYTSMQTGHGRGTSLSRRIERSTDVYAFLFHELGMQYRRQPADAVEL